MILKSADIPYWRLSGFYFFYFAFLGGWVPFWNLYLEQSLRFSAAQVGAISSIVLITKIIGPYLWGWLADHYNKRIEIIRWGSFLAFLCFFAIFFRRDFLGLAIAVAAYSFFWNAVLAQFEVITLLHLKEQSHRYTQIRVWGSIGFIVSVVALGYLLDSIQLDYLLSIFSVLLACIWLCSLLVGDEQSPSHHPLIEGLSHSRLSEFLQQIKHKPIILFFIVCFLVQFSHGAYYTFYTIYLEKLGYERSVIGWLWSLGVIAEVLLFLVMPTLLVRITLHRLFIITIMVTALRWLLIAFLPHYFLALLLAQLMHAASFGSFHAIGIEFVRRYFKAGSLGQGQAFYSAVSFGAGGALGAFISGYCWSLGAPLVFAIAAGAALLALLIAFLMPSLNTILLD